MDETEIFFYRVTCCRLGKESKLSLEQTSSLNAFNRIDAAKSIRKQDERYITSIYRCYCCSVPSGNPIEGTYDRMCYNQDQFCFSHILLPPS